MQKKRLLLASTALATSAFLSSAPALAAEWEVTVGGYMEQWFGYADSSRSFRDGFDQQSDGEIHFLPEITLDNGLKFGANVQLEAQTDGDQIDQQFAYVSGSFGRLVLGSENSAPYLMSITVPSAGAGLDSGDLPDWISGADLNLINTTSNFSADEDSAEKVSYFTPRFYGFQLGVSYVPQLSEDADAAPNTADGVRDDAFGVAVNFDRSFNDFSIGASVGYMHYGDDDTAAGEEPENIGLGLSLGYGGFTVAGAYNDLQDSSVGSIESFGIGAMYETGPIALSIGYIYGEDDGNDRESDAFELGAAYTLGPGVAAVASFYYVDQEFAAFDIEGIAIVGGLSLSF